MDGIGAVRRGLERSECLGLSVEVPARVRREGREAPGGDRVTRALEEARQRWEAESRRASSTNAWIEWSDALAAYDAFAAVSTPEEERFALGATWGRLCNHGAWMANRCHEPVLANEIFSWLLAVCTAREVHANMDLLRRNVKATR